MKVLAIPGSLRQGSYNAALARAAVQLAPEGMEVEVYDGLGALPPFDDDLDGEDAPHPVRELRTRITAADALLVVTPEYNGSIPGVLKNAIDWASRPPGGGAALWGKTAAVAGATTGQYGALWAQQDVRRVLGIAGARVIDGELAVPRAPSVFDESGRLVDTRLATRLRDHLTALAGRRPPAPSGRLTPSSEHREGPQLRPLSFGTSVGVVEALPGRPWPAARQRAPYAG